MDNLQITITDIHLKIQEDFSIGFTLSQIKVFTIDKSGDHVYFLRDNQNQNIRK